MKFNELVLLAEDSDEDILKGMEQVENKGRLIDILKHALSHTVLVFQEMAAEYGDKVTEEEAFDAVTDSHKEMVVDELESMVEDGEITDLEYNQCKEMFLNAEDDITFKDIEDFNTSTFLEEDNEDEDVLKGMEHMEKKMIVKKILQQVLPTAVEDNVDLSPDGDLDEVFDLLIGPKRVMLFPYINGLRNVSKEEKKIARMAVIHRDFKLSDYGVEYESHHDLWDEEEDNEDEDVLRGMEHYENVVVIGKVLKLAMAAAIEDYKEHFKRRDETVPMEHVADLVIGRDKEVLSTYIDRMVEMEDIGVSEAEATKKAIAHNDFNPEDYGVTMDNLYEIE